MATQDLNPSSIIAASGWTGATTGNLGASDDSRATGGTAGELIHAELDNAPGDFTSLNTVTLHVEARRTTGTMTRNKTVLVELLDSGDNVLESFSTAVLGTSDLSYDSSAFSRADSLATVNGYRIRATVQEAGGMGDSIEVEIDRLWATLDYETSATQTASGTPQAEAATAAGQAVREVVAGGAAQAEAATASGSAVREVVASGTPQAEAATTTGAAEILCFLELDDGSGVLLLDAGTTDRLALEECPVSAFGAVQAEPATAAGSAAVERSASGAPQAEPAAASGQAVRESAAGGTPQAEPATASGQATRDVAASGTPQAEPATAAGQAAAERLANGAVQAEAAAASGAATREIVASGAPQAEAATAAGSADVSGEAVASGAVQAEAAAASGQAARAAVASGAVQAEPATSAGAAAGTPGGGDIVPFVRAAVRKAVTAGLAGGLGWAA